MSSRRSFVRNVALGGLISGLSPSVLLASDTEGKKGVSKRVLRIVHITDVHMLDRKIAETCFDRVIQEINALKDKPDLIINSGDSVMDENKQTMETVETRWNSWNNIVNTKNKIPMRSCLGNHDVWYGPDEVLDNQYKKDSRYGKKWAMQELGLPDRYYSFEQGGWKFIALDSINGEKGYQLDDTQFEWLSTELATAKPILIFSHVPILSMGALLYSTKRKSLADVKFPSGDMHNDHQRIKDLFGNHKAVKVCLSGHVHYVDAIEYLGVKYLCNGAVSGNWWGDPLFLDEFPPLYTILDLYDDGSSNFEYIYYNTHV